MIANENDECVKNSASAVHDYILMDSSAEINWILDARLTAYSEGGINTIEKLDENRRNFKSDTLMYNVVNKRHN